MYRATYGPLRSVELTVEGASQGMWLTTCSTLCLKVTAVYDANVTYPGPNPKPIRFNQSPIGWR